MARHCDSMASQPGGSGTLGSLLLADPQPKKRATKSAYLMSARYHDGTVLAHPLPGLEVGMALDEARKVKRIDGWKERIAAARTATDLIDPNTPYLEQRGVIDRALLETANAFIVGSANRDEANRIIGERERVLLVHRW